MIQEDKIIKALRATGTDGFIGDDAAVLPNVNMSNRYVISKDLLIEDVHFRTKYFTPEDLVHKSLHVNLSDIAAMGAQALYILCGISIPSHLQDYAHRLCLEAKIKEGIWLGKQCVVTSMMDVSDGLYIDLKLLASSSKKHIVIDIDLLQSHLNPDVSVQVALEGGEDYVLLVTIHQDAFEELSYRFMESFGYGLKVVGCITDGDGLSFKQNSKPVEITVNHFAHFAERL